MNNSAGMTNVQFKIVTISIRSKYTMNDFFNVYIFPVIYTDSRKNLVDFFISLDEGNHKKEDLWNIYKYGLLSKSLDWKYQKEWRLLTYENAKKDYNYRFFDINKIYLGCKMEKEERSRVIGICNKLRIPWTCVVISDDQFEMKECVSKKCSFAQLIYSYINSLFTISSARLRILFIRLTHNS